MRRSGAAFFRLLGVAGPALLLAGCGIFSGPNPTPTEAAAQSSTPTSGPSVAVPTAAPTPTPAPTPQIVKSLTLVAQVGEPKEWTPAGLTWKGLQQVGSQIGVTPTLIEPVSNADLATELDKAAAADGAIVVTVGAAENAAVQTAAAAHPATHFFELDVAVPAGSPANVHGLVFDEAEAGYLGGFIAAAFATTGKIGMVGDTKADVHSANYAAGFKAGASQSASGVTVSIANVASADQPDQGRAAASSLVKAGAGSIMAMPSLAGIGALRQACSGLVPVIAVDTDAWQTLPDIHPCLVVSVMKRYDTAVEAAVLGIAAGGTGQRISVEDVANGGIALSEFHLALPAGLQARLDPVLATLRSSPPRPTAVPSAAPAAAKSPSPKP